MNPVAIVFRFRLPLALLLLAIASSLSLWPALTHAEGEPIRRTVGDYDIAVSYQKEPLMDVGNALLIEVRDNRTGAPVPGLGGTMQVLGEAHVNEVVRPVIVYMRPAVGKPGVYEGVFVPPAIGEYHFRLTGSINGTPVNEEFTSGGGGLPEVVIAGDSYTSPGAIIALTTLGAFLVGLVVIAVKQRSLHRQRRLPTA